MNRMGASTRHTWYAKAGLLAISLAFLVLIQGCDQIDEFLNPGQPASEATFHVRIENISEAFPYTSSGVFNTPVGSAGPGPAGPGATYEFSFDAAPGSNLSFATMFVQSNDLFYAPGDTGMPLFDAAGNPVSGDVTSEIGLWDAGTEVNEEPGVGPNQAPRQAGPNTGADEGGPVQLVADGFIYPDVADAIQVTVTSTSDTGFTVAIQNIAADDSVILAPGVWVVHTPDMMPLFASGQPDMGMGLEHIAEDGNPADLGGMLASKTGVVGVLAPGIWAVHSAAIQLFQDGQPDAGLGLEALAEDGNPANVAAAVAGASAVMSAGVFSVPDGATDPGPVTPGGAYEFTLDAAEGYYLSFATMFVQSNDLFYAPDPMGIALFDASGVPISGDITMYVHLWDAGTEVNEAPAVGPNQAPRQTGPDTGADENGVVQIVNDGYAYPPTDHVIRVTIDAMP